MREDKDEEEGGGRGGEGRREEGTFAASRCLWASIRSRLISCNSKSCFRTRKHSLVVGRDPHQPRQVCVACPQCRNGKVLTSALALASALRRVYSLISALRSCNEIARIGQISNPEKVFNPPLPRSRFSFHNFERSPMPSPSGNHKLETKGPGWQEVGNKILRREAGNG